MFSLDDAAESLQMSRPTIYRWYTRCRSYGLLQQLAGGDGVYVISYLSIAKAAEQFGVSDLGACGFIPMDKARSLRYLITDLQAEANQRASIYAALKAAGRDLNVDAAENFLIRPIFENPGLPCFPWSGVKRQAGIKHVGPKTAFVAADYLLRGSSQKRLAGQLGLKCSATISRRLSAAVRSQKPYGKERGIEQLQKRQMARQELQTSKQAVLQDVGTVAINQGVDEAEKLSRLFCCSNRVWESGCNLYWITEADIHPKRHWRSAVKKRLPLRGDEGSKSAQGHDVQK